MKFLSIFILLIVATNSHAQTDKKPQNLNCLKFDKVYDWFPKVT